MNKKIVSFLSLFSLVLVLSIYYVMVPIASNRVESVGDNISSNTELTVNEASNLFFTTLEENRKSRHEEVKNAQIEILASAEYTNEQKLEAHNKLTFEELIETTEIGLEQSMTELNFNDVFVEKLDNYFYVTAYDSTLDKGEDIKKVLSISEVFTEYFSTNEINQLQTCKPIINFVSF